MEEFELYNCPHCHAEGVLPMTDMRCPNCKQKIEQVLDIEAAGESQSGTVSKGTVAASFFGSLFIALIITWAFGKFDTEVIRYIHWFPMGLMIFVSESNKAILYGGYAIYAVIFVCAFLYRKKQFFFKLLIIYILLLCLNIGGCAALLNMHIS